MLRRQNSFIAPIRAEATERAPGTVVARPVCDEQCWACLQTRPHSKQKRERPVQCLSRARTGYRTCIAHRRLEDEAQKLEVAS